MILKLLILFTLVISQTLLCCAIMFHSVSLTKGILKSHLSHPRLMWALWDPLLGGWNFLLNLTSLNSVHISRKDGTYAPSAVILGFLIRKHQDWFDIQMHNLYKLIHPISLPVKMASHLKFPFVVVKNLFGGFPSYFWKPGRTNIFSRTPEMHL